MLLVGVGAVALHGVQACTSDTELNPQPLPPQGGEAARDPSSREGDKGNASAGASPPAEASGASSDGGDGGTDAGRD